MIDLYNLLIPFFDGDLFDLIIELNGKIEPSEITYGQLGVTRIIDFILR